METETLNSEASLKQCCEKTRIFKILDVSEKNDSKITRSLFKYFSLFKWDIFIFNLVLAASKSKLSSNNEPFQKPLEWKVTIQQEIPVT